MYNSIYFLIPHTVGRLAGSFWTITNCALFVEKPINITILLLYKMKQIRDDQKLFIICFALVPKLKTQYYSPLIDNK